MNREAGASDEATADDRVEAIIDLVRDHALRAGSEADYSVPDLVRLEQSLRRAHTVQAVSATLKDVVAALRFSMRQRDEVLPAAPRWSQLVNRLTDRLFTAQDLDRDAALRALRGFCTEVRAARLEKQVHRDLIASAAAAAAWRVVKLQWVHDFDRAEEMFAELGSPFDDTTFETYFRLYVLRVQYRQQELVDESKAADPTNDPVIAAFHFHAEALGANWDAAMTAWDSCDTRDGAAWLAPAKLLGSALPASAPPTRDFRRSVELCQVLEAALETWRQAGADSVYFAALAEYHSWTPDREQVNEAILASIALTARAETTVTEDYRELARLRARLHDRIRLREELDEVRRIKDDAEAALTAASGAADGARSAATKADDAAALAHETAGQIPVVIGLFAAVIALVIGSSRIASDLGAREAVLVVAALGAVLLGFVGGLAAVNTHITRPRDQRSLPTLAAAMAGIVVVVAGLLAVIVWTI